MTWLEFATLTAVVTFYVVCICIYVIRWARARRKSSREEKLVVKGEVEMKNLGEVEENGE